MDERRSMDEPNRLSPSPDPEHLTDNETHEAGRRMKRDRDQAYGPSTPKGEGEEAKLLAGITPQAKKGRVQPESLDKSAQRQEPPSDDDESLPGDDDNRPSTSSGRPSASRRAEVTPPPPGLETDSAPATPLVSNSRSLPLKSEGKDTRNLRQRVEALEWEDDQRPPLLLDKDSEIANVASEVAESAEGLDPHDSSAPDVHFSDVVDDPKAVEHERAMDVADVASEVAESAAQVQREDLKDVEIAEVAAEVATSAAGVDQAHEQAVEVADVAAEVSESSAILSKEDEKEAAVAAEVSETAKALDVAPTTPARAATPSRAPTSFTSHSAVASPFSSFTSSASPFAAVAPKPAPPPPPPAEQKPKAKSTFSAPFISASPSTPAPSRVLPPSNSFATPKPAPATTPSITPPLPPSTPFSKSLATPGASVASPFAAFASSSGFANVASSSSSAFGSYSAQTASPFASIPRSAPSENEDRKIGEPVEQEVGKRVFTEQEHPTGEEDDDTLHSVKCKLFVMAAGAWVERGTGLLKLNVSRDSTKKIARLVMRADATHRLLLNATLFSAFSIEIFQEKYVRFAIIEGHDPVSYMLRMAGAPSAQTLVQTVRARVEQL